MPNHTGLETTARRLANGWRTRSSALFRRGNGRNARMGGLGQRVAVVAPDETMPVVPLGFERTDVFAFTREAEAMLGGPVDWARLSRF